jgi:transcriptional regulator with XRE-family HTH domain
MNEDHNNQIKNIFGTNLKIKRTIRGLTQEELAEKLGVEVRTISRIETGEFGTEFSTIEKISKALNVEAYELFLPLEETGSVTTEQLLPIESQKIYREEIQRISNEEKINAAYKHQVIRNKTEANRFKQNRNSATNKLAPIRVAALAITYSRLIAKFPQEDPGAIWAYLQKVHYQIAVDVDFPTKIAEKFVSAHQSWVKTSGTAFEAFIIKKLDAMLAGLLVLRPGDFKKLCAKSQVINADKLIGKLEDDLLVVFNKEDTHYLVGVIQAKTSVRERIREDAAHSQKMLTVGLWSAHMTIDPDNFLANPKFRQLADGVSELGHVWHGVYKLSSIVSESVGVFDFDKLEKHLGQVVETVLKNEMMAGWRPQ